MHKDSAQRLIDWQNLIISRTYPQQLMNWMSELKRKTISCMLADVPFSLFFLKDRLNGCNIAQHC